MVHTPDIASSFPDDIVHAIFSLLPLKDAVKTGILSSVWRSLWLPIQVGLDVDTDQITSHEVIKEITRIIGTFLVSCNGPRKLYLGIPNREKVNLPKMKNEWFLMATMVEAKELHLSSSEGNQLTKDYFNLVLDRNCPKLGNYLTGASGFASLKILHLRSVNYITKNMVAALFSNCHLLEALKLVKCSGLQQLDLKGGSHFESFEMLDCPELVNIKLSAPKLKSFRYRGILAYIQIKEASGLIDALLDFRYGPGCDFDCEELISLLKALKDVEILTLTGWLLEWMCSAGVIFGKLEFQFNKLQELWWIGSQIERIERNSLACFLNCTPFLERLFIDIDKRVVCAPCPPFHHYWHEPHLWMDYATVKCSGLPLESLKTVFIHGFTSQKEELLVVGLLLTRASELKSVIVNSPQTVWRRVSKIPKSPPKRTWIRQWKIFSVSSAEDEPADEWFYENVEGDRVGLLPAHSKML